MPSTLLDTDPATNRKHFPTLESTTATLPKLEVLPVKKGGLPPTRGNLVKRHLGVWTDYMKMPHVISDMRRVKKGVNEYPIYIKWMTDNTQLFKKLGQWLAILNPDMYMDMMKLKRHKDEIIHYLEGQIAMPTPWHAVAINEQSGGGLDRESGHHFDPMDHLHNWNCVVPFGQFTGGKLRISSLLRDVELPPGTVLMMYPAMTRHGVMPVTFGSRNSLDLFSHHSNKLWVDAAEAGTTKQKKESKEVRAEAWEAFVAKRGKGKELGA